MFKFPSFLGQQPIKKSNNFYSENPVTKTHTKEEFANCLSYNDTLGICYSGGKLIRFDKIESSIFFPPILITTSVYNGFKKANPNRNSIIGNYWQEISNHNIKNVTENVFGATVNWII